MANQQNITKRTKLRVCVVHVNTLAGLQVLAPNIQINDKGPSPIYVLLSCVHTNAILTSATCSCTPIPDMSQCSKSHRHPNCGYIEFIMFSIVVIAYLRLNKAMLQNWYGRYLSPCCPATVAHSDKYRLITSSLTRH